MKLTVYLLGIALIILSLGACNDDDDDKKVSVEVTESMVAEVIANSLASNSGGLTRQIGSHELINKDIFSKDKKRGENEFIMLIDTTFSIKNLFDTDIKFNYLLDLDYAYEMVSLIPLKFNAKLNYTATGDYTTPWMSSSDNSTGNYNLVVEDILSHEVMFSGTYSRKGTQTSHREDDDVSFSSDFKITFKDMVLNSTTHAIVSGNAPIEFNGITSNGKPFNYKGILEYNKNEAVTLNLNGKTYSINLLTGEVSKQ